MGAQKRLTLPHVYAGLPVALQLLHVARKRHFPSQPPDAPSVADFAKSRMLAFLLRRLYFIPSPFTSVGGKQPPGNVRERCEGSAFALSRRRGAACPRPRPPRPIQPPPPALSRKIGVVSTVPQSREHLNSWTGSFQKDKC